MVGMHNSTFIKSLKVTSPYDSLPDELYIKSKYFTGFNNNLVKYLSGTLKSAFSSDVFIIGHINLAILGVLAKILRPKLQLIVIAHGIDVWYELSYIKKLLLKKADIILSVSSFTKQKLKDVHGISGKKIKLFPNTIDPFFCFPDLFIKPLYLTQRYKLSPEQPTILSICRLSSKEGYKGYDTVIKALPSVIQHYPDLKYIIVGKYDQQEYDRVIALAKIEGVSDNILVTGFVSETELTDHYLLGDLFVMPSREEGFGIVYIEAMACGLPVIAGNADGSVDALDNGKLGTLVDPTSPEAVTDAILQNLSKLLDADQKLDLQRRVIEKFGFDKFKDRLNSVLEEISKAKNVRY